MYEVKNLSVTIRGNDRSSDILAVDSVSFSGRQRETLAIVGESGCGKTLTALAMLRLFPEDMISVEAEKLEVAGEDILSLDRKGLKKIHGKITSVVFQEPRGSLNPLFRVGWQLEETVHRHSDGSVDPPKRARQALLEAGLEDAGRIYDSYPHQLSGGQCQRVMLALALCTDPRLLIADEPTTALDVTVQVQILATLEKLLTEKNLAVILISHDLRVVERLADRVIVMYAGQVVEEAPRREIFESPAHPYTKALLDCLPGQNDKDESAGKRFIPGQVPAPGDWPVGCRFRERCTLARPGCEKEQHLETLKQKTEQKVRCWLVNNTYF